MAAAGAFLGAAYAFQQRFRTHEHTWREYPGVEYNDFPIPPDYQEKTEWAFARLMYPHHAGRARARRFGFGRFGGVPTTGRRAAAASLGPRITRARTAIFRRPCAGSRASTRARSEQPINLDEGDQYDWPWLYAVEVGHWNLTDAQAKALREYLDRGGFFMCDDFHGTEEWAVFIASM